MVNYILVIYIYIQYIRPIFLRIPRDSGDSQPSGTAQSSLQVRVRLDRPRIGSLVANVLPSNVENHRTKSSNWLMMVNIWLIYG